ncbi:PASTA domain-containing protein [Nocardioides sp. B-3]|nr:PASTA domain-containing protein [Nocardioides sp. B-3]UUZ61074.1 PASTA domain-containing protein [Nocardioides sp. B-3]
MPALVGMTQNEARAAIRDAGLSVGTVSREPSDTVPVDVVIEQTPNRDLYVEPGSAVDFILSLGMPEVGVPYVPGQPKEAARTVLESNNLRVKFETGESDEPKDTVVDSDPASGQQVPEGTTVTLFVSAGPKSVPNVIGMPKFRAEKTLTAAGFEVEVREDPSSTEPKRTVVDQIPADGTADRGRHDHHLRVDLRGAGRDSASHRDATADGDASDDAAGRDTVADGDADDDAASPLTSAAG